MALIHTLQSAVKTYLDETRREVTHFLNVLIEEHDGRLWLIDAAHLPAGKGGGAKGPVIYCSVNRSSKRGRRVAEAIDVLEPFEGYEVWHDNRFLNFHKATNGKPADIAKELTRMINTLFPTVPENEVELALYPLEGKEG